MCFRFWAQKPPKPKCFAGAPGSQVPPRNLSHHSHGHQAGKHIDLRATPVHQVDGREQLQTNVHT